MDTRVLKELYKKMQLLDLFILLFVFFGNFFCVLSVKIRIPKEKSKFNFDSKEEKNFQRKFSLIFLSVVQQRIRPHLRFLHIRLPLRQPGLLNNLRDLRILQNKDQIPVPRDQGGDRQTRFALQLWPAQLHAAGDGDSDDQALPIFDRDQALQVQ